jgi:hypothetical protein
MQNAALQPQQPEVLVLVLVQAVLRTVEMPVVGGGVIPVVGGGLMPLSRMTRRMIRRTTLTSHETGLGCLA